MRNYTLFDFLYELHQIVITILEHNTVYMYLILVSTYCILGGSVLKKLNFATRRRDMMNKYT